MSEPHCLSCMSAARCTAPLQALLCFPLALPLLRGGSPPHHCSLLAVALRIAHCLPLCFAVGAAMAADPGGPACGAAAPPAAVLCALVADLLTRQDSSSTARRASGGCSDGHAAGTPCPPGPQQLACC